MGIPQGLFIHPAKQIAQGLKLKQAALSNKLTKGTKFKSAMSMLNYYINRAGKNLSTENKTRLEQAKIELRKVFNKQSPKK